MTLLGEITKIVEEVTRQQKEKGHSIFWKKNRVFKTNELTVGEALCMIAGELAGEAMEAYRDNNMKKFAKELADGILRICHLAGSTNVDLETAVKDALAENWSRPFCHGRVNF